MILSRRSIGTGHPRIIWDSIRNAVAASMRSTYVFSLYCHYLEPEYFQFVFSTIFQQQLFVELLSVVY
jgi:hypothetical protein